MSNILARLKLATRVASLQTLTTNAPIPSSSSRTVHRLFRKASQPLKNHIRQVNSADLGFEPGSARFTTGQVVAPYRSRPPRPIVGARNLIHIKFCRYDCFEYRSAVVKDNNLLPTRATIIIIGLPHF